MADKSAEKIPAAYSAIMFLDYAHMTRGRHSPFARAASGWRRADSAGGLLTSSTGLAFLAAVVLFLAF